MTRDPIENADQPPEVDIHDDRRKLPPAAAAAERVREFVSWFGDGAIMGHSPDSPEGPPLYARDLEALASAVKRVAALHNADGLRWVHDASLPGAQPGRANRQEPYCTHCNLAAPCPTIAALGADQ